MAFLAKYKWPIIILLALVAAYMVYRHWNKKAEETQSKEIQSNAEEALAALDGTGAQNAQSTNPSKAAPSA